MFDLLSLRRLLPSVLCLWLTVSFSRGETVYVSKEGATQRHIQTVHNTVSINYGTAAGSTSGSYFIRSKENGHYDPNYTRVQFWPNGSVTIRQNGTLDVPTHNTLIAWNTASGNGYMIADGAPVTVVIEVFQGSLTGPLVSSKTIGQWNGVTRQWVSGMPTGGELINFNSSITLTGEDQCPPRDLKFLMSLGVTAGPHESHNLMVTLTIASASETTSDYQVVAPMIIKGPLSLSLEHDVPNVPGAFSYSWKYNGVIVASGSYGCGDEVPLNRVVDEADVVADPLNDQDADGDPDITDPDDDGDGIPDDKEPPPDTPPTPPPSTPPPGTNGGTGAPDGSAGSPILQPGKTNPLPPGLGAGSGNTIGDVNVLNIQDFAKAFKWAMEESGNGNGFFSSPGNGALPTAGLTGPSDDGEELSTAPIDDLVEAMGTMRTAKDDAASLAEAMNTTMESHRPSLPAPVPTVATWRVQLGSTNGALFGRDYFDVDLSPYSAAIGIFRQVVSWILLVMAWFKFWNYFRAIVTV